MGYRWLEDLTRADVAFEAAGDTPAEVLLASWSAVVEVMLPGLGSVLAAGHPRRRRILSAGSWEELLFDLLEWVVYVKDAECLILVPGEVVARVPGAADVHAWCLPLDGSCGEPGTDVKAVTMHRFAMERVSQGWRATVILDV